MSLFFFLQMPREQPAADTELQWLRWDSKKAYMTGRGEVTLDEIATLLADEESTNVLIAPGEDIRSIQVSLPNKSKAAFNTIPYQLEENVASKLEDLHIVSTKAQDKVVTSFVIEHSRMQQWQQLIAQTKVTFRWLIADFALLPTFDDSGSAWSDGKRALVHSSIFQGALSDLNVQTLPA